MKDLIDIFPQFKRAIVNNAYALAIFLICVTTSGGLPTSASAETVSLCDFSKDSENFVGNMYTVDGTFTTTYHIIYLASDNCPDEWFAIQLNDSINGTNENVIKYHSAMNPIERMKGKTYKIEIVGEFRKFAADDRKFKTYAGRFIVSEIKYFEATP